MNHLKSNWMRIAIAVLALGALAGCAYSAAAIATFASVLIAQQMHGVSCYIAGDVS